MQPTTAHEADHPVLNGLQRSVEAEARDKERVRTQDILVGEILKMEKADHRSREGHIRKGLEWALELLPRPRYTDDGPWTELIASISGGVDGIDVGLNLDLDGEVYDAIPFRLRLDDGCDGTTAFAYLSEANVDELIDALQHAKKRWAARPPLPKELTDEPAGQGMADGPDTGR